MLRRTLFQLAFCTIMLAGCINPSPVSLAGKQFRLIKLTFDNIKYKETICQFNTDKVEVWSYNDTKKWHANLIVGGYSVNNKYVKLPFGEFETKRAKDGYYLYANGLIKYKMVVSDGRL
ncbi:hypothetical protein [Pedobacter sp. B4-66]|uniref:hypothetical protein n=1 Tax=Pedobacter sp. B4-66 TaxID=2817280 RepID=UPI001BDB0BF4|nr:hypothetical protein [Pedobacter sp. B4-66]